MNPAQKITPCLWFETQALEAAEFYAALFPGSSIDKVYRSPADTPGTKQGNVLLVEFTLAGQKYQALNGGPHDTANDAISLSVSCDDQAEVDKLSDGLTAGGGRLVQCGWLKDRYGFSWQIVPKRMGELMRDPDPAKAKRVMQAMMEMIKLDIAELERAASGG
jgi:predicted 3-demethylubiquinone-9 3-methyltransferase (glyoxalase superfamily)